MSKKNVTAVYGDPILTADEINLAAYEEAMARFAYASANHDYEMADSALDHRYDVITDDQMQDARTWMSPDSHRVDRNPPGVWPYPNPYGPGDPR